MKASEFFNSNEYYDSLAEAKLVWGRSAPTARGGQTKLTYRCTSGPRKSRQVSHPSKCFDHPNVAQSQRMKTTRARTAPTQARHQKRTKSINTASAIVKKLNQGGTGTVRPWY